MVQIRLILTFIEMISYKTVVPPPRKITPNIFRACTHDEKEIQGLREKVRELQNSLVKTKINVEKKEENCRDLENEVR